MLVIPSYGAASSDSAWTSVPEELLVCGEQVVALGVEQGRAHSTGRAFMAAFAHTWTLHEGQVVHFQGIVDTAVIRRAFERESDGVVTRPVRSGDDRRV